MNKFFENYEAFYNMVLSTTVMSNALSPAFIADAEKVIHFIGKAYRLDDDFIEDCSSLILNDLTLLGLHTDQLAIYGDRTLWDEYSDKDVLFDIKGDVLTKLQKMHDDAKGEINPGWFDYSHYKTYQANVRFSKICTASATGDLITTRQTGIMRVLGIGCPVDVKEGIRRLFQCTFWGDIPSAHFISYAYSLIGDEENSAVFHELAELFEKYLKSGCTVLPSSEKNAYSEKAREYYVYASSIKQDVVYAYERYNIDFSFIEALSSPELDYFKKMYYINNYRNQDWREVTNSSADPNERLGF